MLHVAAYRPPLGPNIIAKYEYELSALEGIGLSDVEMDSVLTLVLGYVAGAARGSVEAAQAEQQTGVTDEQWWAAHDHFWRRSSTRRSSRSRPGSAGRGEEYGGPSAPDFAFEFGLSACSTASRSSSGRVAVARRPPAEVHRSAPSDPAAVRSSLGQIQPRSRASSTASCRFAAPSLETAPTTGSCERAPGDQCRPGHSAISSTWRAPPTAKSQDVGFTRCQRAASPALIASAASSGST